MMDNRQISARLAMIAVLKELSGENAFKTRAFENAARIMESLSESAELLAKENRLTEIRGIGTGIAEVITELVAHGASAEETRLEAEIPGGLIEMLGLQGMGPKKVRAVWKQLGITTLAGLEAACKAGKLEELAGFGKKTEENILKAIAFKKESSGFMLSFDALAIAQAVRQELDCSGLFYRVEIAGSLRRGKELVKDADILVAVKKAAASGINPHVREKLLSFADPLESGKGRAIMADGPTKISIRHSGLAVDFRIIEKKSFACALQYFSGSKEHNTQLRGLAKNQGRKINEYDVTGPDGPWYPESEKEMYESLGLDWIPPELREAQGEIEAAANHTLPNLVTEADFTGLIHAHTTSSDGELTLLQLATECKNRGYQYVCVSDHSQSAPYAGGLSAERLLVQGDEIDLLNKKLAPFRIFKGVESDIHTDGTLDYPDHVLQQLDFVIGAVHSKFNMTPDEATSRLVTAVSNPRLTILAHPSARLLLQREGYAYDEDELIKACAKHGVVLEHNSNPFRLDIPWQMIKKAGRAGVLVSVNPDLHGSAGFEHITGGITMARKAWLSKTQILNCKTKEEIDEHFRQRKT